MASDHNHRRKPLPPPQGLSLKQSLRLGGTPRLARLGRLLGMDWKKLGALLGREVLIEQVRQIERGGIEKADHPLDVVFLTMMGGHHHNVSVDIVLALALEARGHRIRFVLCDQQLPVCEVKKAGREESWQQSCAKCYGFGKAYLESADFPTLTVSELAGDPSPEVGAWEDIVEASLLKHYRVGVLDPNPEVEQRQQMFQKSAAISAAVGRALIEKSPDRVIMSHGIYATWGPAFRLLQEAGIPVVTYAKGKRKATEKFNWNATSNDWDVSNEWTRVKEVPLASGQEAQLDSYLSSRRDHSADTVRYNFAEEEDISRLRQRLDLTPDKPTYVLFTNVLWDAASAQREIVFENPIDWVLQTIRWFAEHPDRQLVVKVHPAELIIGTEQSFVSIIKGAFPRLPPNVRIIEPREKVNSWSVIHVADLGLVHTSTIGMELPLEGIPCAVVSHTHYRGKGFTIDVERREEYFRLLDTFDPASVDRGRIVELSRRYAFLLFERYQLPFPYLYEIHHTDARAFEALSVEMFFAEGELSSITSSIERKEAFLLPL